MSMTIGQAISKLQANGHTFLATELEKAVDLSLKRIAGQQAETEPQPEQQQETDPFQAIFDSRGYQFPSNTR